MKETWENLRSLLACFFAGAAVDLLAVVRPQPGRPSRARDREALQDRHQQVQRLRKGVDEKICHVILCVASPLVEFIRHHASERKTSFI